MTKTSYHAVAALVGLAGLAFGSATTVSATEYSYARQSLTNLTLTTTGSSSAATGSTSTSDSAMLSGSGITSTSPTDAPQAYIGALPAASENNFSKHSSSGGGPQAGDFARGDVLLSNSLNILTTGASASGVAEAFNSLSNANRTASSASTIISSLVTTGSSITLNYGFVTDILATVSGATEAAQAAFTFIISVDDQYGHEVDAMPKL